MRPTSRHSTTPRDLSRRRRHRGFTLVELMISLVMGLIVALAAVALARSSTSAFHEQARSSITEMGVRSGAERLRQDLMRVSYMVTGNIVYDPKVVQMANWTPIQKVREPFLNNLQGLHIEVGGSRTADVSHLDGTLGLSTNNLVNPDSITITGNFTTDDSYNGQIMMDTAGCGGGGSQVVRLDPLADAAVYGLMGSETGASTLTNVMAAFQPVAGQRFIAQVTDPMGCVHYAPICNVTVDTGNIISVHLGGIGGNRGVLYSHTATGEYESNPGLSGNCGASESGPVTIAPVQRIRWRVQTTDTALQAPPPEVVGNKFDLVRQMLDYENQPAGPGEVVAEYAVDLKFGITAINPTALKANTDPLVITEMDQDPGGGAGPIDVTTRDAVTTTLTQTGPQHVRSVRFRLAIRGTTDRESDIQVGPPRGVGNPYMSRYCMENNALPACKKFARVRTVVSEVTLQNQARMFYPPQP